MNSSIPEAEVPSGGPVAEPANALSRRYLQILRERDDVATALEAASAGPFKLLPVEEGQGLFRLWESPEAGHRPLAMFADRATALRFMVVWNVIGREPMTRFVAKELLLTYYEPPASDCSVPRPKEILDYTFRARFEDSRGGILVVSAETTDEPRSSGVLNSARAEWRKGRLDLSVTSNLGGRGLGREARARR